MPHYAVGIDSKVRTPGDFLMEDSAALKAVRNKSLIGAATAGSRLGDRTNNRHFEGSICSGNFQSLAD
jgi:hypothetical protein